MENRIISFLQQQALMLMQALLGVISPNFRMVSVSEVDKKILIRIILENESESDRDEIEDLISEFEALQSGPIDFEIEVEILNNELIWRNESTIVVYLRKEN